MSASAKLRALAEGIEGERPWRVDYGARDSDTAWLGRHGGAWLGADLPARGDLSLENIAAVLNALPKLIAVVEAAEQARPVPEFVAPIRATVAALDAKLGGNL